MSDETLYASLLNEARTAYVAHPDMLRFARFPDDVRRQPIEPYHCACADYLHSETGLTSPRYKALQDAIIAAGPAAIWRETYKGTDIDPDFMTRFACYCIIGEGGPFHSERLRLYIVFMPSHLNYPWHHHPAEEIYMVVSGSAVFKAKGQRDKILYAGDTAIHESNQPHAMETGDGPVLCLVAWRDQFGTPPVWSETKDPENRT